MSHRFLRSPLVAFVLCAAPLVVAAQAAPSTPPARPSPLDANASVPPLVQRSALAGYRKLREEPLQPWKQANDEVARIGGWRAYAREAAQPASAPASVPGARP